MLSLVRELLLQLDMRQTLAVFDAESTVDVGFLSINSLFLMF